MAVAVVSARIDRRGIGMLSFGHLSVDLVQGAVPPLLPFLVRERGYSYAEAGSLLLFSSLGSSLLQPLLGAIADRVRSTWLIPAGPALAALGIAMVGMADSYLATGAALGVASIGVAMYHPEAVRFADYVSRASGRRGAGMSMFAVGGISGWALAPAIVTPAVILFGVPGVALVAIVPLIASLVLWTQLDYLGQYRPGHGSIASARAAYDALARESLGRLHARGQRRDRAHRRAVRAAGVRAAVPLEGARHEPGRRQPRRQRAAGDGRRRRALRRAHRRPLRVPAARRVVARDRGAVRRGAHVRARPPASSS